MNSPSSFLRWLIATLVGRTLASLAPAAVSRIQQLRPFVPSASRIALALATCLR